MERGSPTYQSVLIATAGGPVKTLAELEAALKKGVEVLNAGGVCLIDAHVHAFQHLELPLLFGVTTQVDMFTGVTIMQMDAGLDTGDMLLCEALAMAPTDTTAVLHDRLAALGGEAIVQALASLDALPPGAVVGTSSLRRVALLRALRPRVRQAGFQRMQIAVDVGKQCQFHDRKLRRVKSHHHAAYALRSACVVRVRRSVALKLGH